MRPFEERLRFLLHPGDLLLYSGTGWVSRAIKIKTWSDVSHCETYLGVGISAASRDGQGVGTYALRVDGLRYVLRPTSIFDLIAGFNWHKSHIGKKYDWMALAGFFLIGKESPTRMICSEHATGMARAMGLKPFDADFPAAKVSPGMLLASTAHDLALRITGDVEKGTAHVEEIADSDHRIPGVVGR